MPSLRLVLDPISLKWRSRGIGPALLAKQISQTGELILICSPAVPFALPLFGLRNAKGILLRLPSSGGSRRISRLGLFRRLTAPLAAFIIPSLVPLSVQGYTRLICCQIPSNVLPNPSNFRHASIA